MINWCLDDARKKSIVFCTIHNSVLIDLRRPNNSFQKLSLARLSQQSEFRPNTTTCHHVVFRKFHFSSKLFLFNRHCSTCSWHVWFRFVTFPSEIHLHKNSKLIDVPNKSFCRYVGTDRHCLLVNVGWRWIPFVPKRF